MHGVGLILPLSAVDATAQQRPRVHWWGGMVELGQGRVLGAAPAAAATVLAAAFTRVLLHEEHRVRNRVLEVLAVANLLVGAVVVADDVDVGHGSACKAFEKGTTLLETDLVDVTEALVVGRWCTTTTLHWDGGTHLLR